jgi:hypothetical protein
MVACSFIKAPPSAWELKRKNMKDINLNFARNAVKYLQDHLQQQDPDPQITIYLLELVKTATTNYTKIKTEER